MAKQFQLGPLQRKWVEALRSGEYQQGRQWLNRDGKWCCLGVAHAVCGAETTPYHMVLSPVVQEQMKFRTKNGTLLEGHQLQNAVCLDGANDGGTSFDAIADFVEQHPEAVFTEPA